MNTQASLNSEEVISELRSLLPKLSQDYGVKKIGIFGSVARNEARPESDLDVVVELADPDLFILVHLKALLEEDFHCSVDLIHLRGHMNPYLRSIIVQEALYA